MITKSYLRSISSIPYGSLFFSLSTAPFHAYSAANQPQCSPTDAIYAGCTTKKWVGEDQGSIAESHKRFFKDVIKPEFQTYKQNHLSYITTNSQYKADSIESLKDLSAILKLRLKKWSDSDSDSFTSYFSNTGTNASSTEIHSAYIEAQLPLFKTLYRQIHHRTAANYFHANPRLFKGIEYNYWYKSYWPFWGGSGKWGGVAAYSDSDSVYRAPYYYGFVSDATPSDYVFSQEEGYFSDKWNNTDLGPTVKNETYTKYYKLGSVDDSQFIQALYDADPETLSKEMRESIGFETLNKTQSMVLHTTLNLVKYSVLSNTQNQEDRDATLADFFAFSPHQYSFSPTTRLINKRSQQCLGIADSNTASMFDCNTNERHLDWFVTEQQDRYFLLKNTDQNLCLTADQVDSYLVLASCDSAMDKQLWRADRSSEMLENKVILGVIDLPDGGGSGSVRLGSKKRITEDNNSQKWTINLVSSLKKPLLTTEYYTKQPKHILVRNFPVILYAYALQELGSPRDKKITAFFSGISNLNYFEQLPDTIRSISQEIAQGKSVLTAYQENREDLLKQIKAASVFYPTRWNESTKIGDIHVYDNPFNGDSELFTPKFSGNASDHHYPTDKKSNSYWNFLGTIGNKAQISKLFSDLKSQGLFNHGSSETVAGKLYLSSDSPNERVFLSKSNGRAVNSFPHGESSDADWYYLGGRESGAVIVAAYVNYLNSIYIETNLNNIDLYAGSASPGYAGFADSGWSVKLVTFDIKPPFVDQADVSGISVLLNNTDSFVKGHPSIPLSNTAAIFFGGGVPDGGAIGGLSRLQDAAREFVDLWLKNIDRLTEENNNFVPGSREVFIRWGRNELNPPDQYWGIRDELIDALGDEEQASWFVRGHSGAGAYDIGRGVAEWTNNLVSSSFNALSVSSATIPVANLSVVS